MAMQESVLSSRRSPPTTGEDNGEDDSKKRKGISLWTRLVHHHHPVACNGSRLGQLAVIFAFAVVVTLLYVASSRSEGFVCFSPQDALLRMRLYGSGQVEGFGFDFGSLGVPWCRTKNGKTVEWTTKDLIKGLEDFVPIYETRPINNNMFGMGFDHSFGLWFMAQWLKPELMIESGAFKGHSTWVLRQAMPFTPIISLSPRHPEKYLKKGPAYVDENCTYLAGKDFVDFGSADWRRLMKQHGISDLSKVLVFFDDHQNELKRIKQALKAGFQNLIFEDNYDTGTGDHYSLRQICDQSYIKGGGHSCFRDSDEARIRSYRRKFWEKAVDIEELCGKGEAWWGVKGQMRDNFNHSNNMISYAEHFQNSRFIESVLDVYWELPPVAGPSLTHQNRYDPARASTPMVEDGMFGLFEKLGLSRLHTSVFNGYTQMVYIQISVPTK